MTAHFLTSLVLRQTLLRHLDRRPKTAPDKGEGRHCRGHHRRTLRGDEQTGELPPSRQIERRSQGAIDLYLLCGRAIVPRRSNTEQTAISAQSGQYREENGGEQSF